MKRIHYEIVARVSGAEYLDADETPEQFKERNIDIYLHGKGENGYHDKQDLGVDSCEIIIHKIEESIKIILSDDDRDEFKVYAIGLTGDIYGESMEVGTMDDCVSFAKANDLTISNLDELKSMVGTVMKDEVESILINMLSSILPKLPENLEEITQYVYEHIIGVENYSNWSDDDVRDGLQHWMESK